MRRSTLHKDRAVQVRGDDGGHPVYCAVDRSRLEQVFRNMLENALMACTDPVEITWQLSEAEVEEQQVVRIVLADNGPGLSDEQKQKIFDPFYTTKSNGTGLGMAICRRIVESHGGQIAAENLQGHGARFVITLPQVELAPEANGRDQDANLLRPGLGV